MIVHSQLYGGRREVHTRSAENPLCPSQSHFNRNPGGSESWLNRCSAWVMHSRCRPILHLELVPIRNIVFELLPMVVAMSGFKAVCAFFLGVAVELRAVAAATPHA